MASKHSLVCFLVFFMQVIAKSGCSTTDELSLKLLTKLTDWNLRRVPLAKQYGEEELKKLYKLERTLNAQMAELKKKKGNANLRYVSQHSPLFDLVDDEKLDDDEMPTFGGTLEIATRLSARFKVNLETDLAKIQIELANIARKIEEANFIRKNPESYISLPKYGHENLEVVQLRMLETLETDRFNMDYRRRVNAGEIDSPMFLVDKW